MASSHATQLDSVVDAVRSVLRERPSALITDIDGTISRIAPTPDEAFVEEPVRFNLELLARRLDLVAIVSARTPESAREMVAVTNVAIVGHYGLTREASVALEDALAIAKSEAKHLEAETPGLLFEDKGLSFALHYRNSPDPDAVRESLLAAVAPIAARHGARVVEGKRVIELVPAALPGKLSAVQKLCADHGIRGLVYLGDDVSDIPVFEEIRRRREFDYLPGLGLAALDVETPARVAEAADELLAGVDAVELLLDALAAGYSEAASDA